MLPKMNVVMNSIIKYEVAVLIVTILLLGLGRGVRAHANGNPVGEQAPKLMAHYMPWYAAKPFSQRWGWHWTMGHFAPDTLKSDGRRNIASHYYPLIGPYDSADPDALECQVLLMKFAGIDGIIVDWYGIQDFRDYGALHRNTQRVIEQVTKAGLEYAICYEDQSVKHMVEQGHLPEEQAVSHGQSVMRWLEDHCFDDEAYLKLGQQPVLLVFGPQYFRSAQWDELFSVLRRRPRFYTLNRTEPIADGAFAWPPMDGGTTTKKEWQRYLMQFHAKAADGGRVAAVFPQFHDVYGQAGLHQSYGHLDTLDGKTFSETLDIALTQECDLVQIVTWNDYGEGTMIEPTVEFGYRYLEHIQERVRQREGAGFGYAAADLRLPIRLYKMRKTTHDTRVNQLLDQCVELQFLGDTENARRLLDQVAPSGIDARVR